MTKYDYADVSDDGNFKGRFGCVSDRCDWHLLERSLVRCASCWLPLDDGDERMILSGPKYLLILFRRSQEFDFACFMRSLRWEILSFSIWIEMSFMVLVLTSNIFRILRGKLYLLLSVKRS